MNEKLHVLQRRVRSDTNGCIRNHLLSIIEDSERIDKVYDVIGSSIALFANKRNGEWYINTNKISNHNSCYFKSTDGHDNNWQFSNTRLNLDVVIKAVEHNGALIIDSTRRGKIFPDSMRSTIPIWCSIINAIIFNKDIPKLEKPPTMSKSHISLINSMLGKMIKSIPNGIIDIIIETLQPILQYPLKPIWIYPSEEDGEIEWYGSNVDEVVEQLPNINIDRLGYVPIILFSCSRVITELDDRINSWTYIQGSGDDEENWCQGLNAEKFWRYKDIILASDDPNEVENACKMCIQQAIEKEHDINKTQYEDSKLPLESFSYIGQTGLIILQYFLSNNIELSDLLQRLYKKMININKKYDETPMILIIEPNTINDKTIIRYSNIVLICYISFQKKNSKEQNNIWCNEIFPACITFYNEHSSTITVVSNDGILASVIAIAMICSKETNVDKHYIKSTAALIQSFASNIIIPRRFNKFLNNFFLA